MSNKKQHVDLNKRIEACQACPRLVHHCRDVARKKRAGYSDWTYWGKPVPNFGDIDARLLIVGLAPAAHGANRTGRMFTGDRSGDFLFRAMHDTGYANQPGADHANDGLTLSDALITAACHCAPPGNKPAAEELATCSTFLDETIAAMQQLQVVMCLGKIALDAMLRYYKRRGWIKTMAPYKFGHAAVHIIKNAPTLICSYHPSQQNTFTGKLTAAMLRNVFDKARQRCDDKTITNNT